MADKYLGRTTAASTFFLMIGRLVGIVLLGITFIAVARLLGPVNYGLYALAIGFSGVVDAVGGLGIGQYFLKRIAELRHLNNYRKIGTVVSSGFLLFIVITAVMMVVGVLLIPYLLLHYFTAVGITAFALYLALAIAFFMSIQNVSYSALIGLGRSGMASLLLTMTYSINFVASIALIEAGYGVNGALEGLLLGYVVGLVVQALLIFAVIRKRARFQFPNMNDIREAFGFSWPLAGTTLMSNFSLNLVILLIGVLFGAYAAGNYNAAARGLSMIIIIYSTLTVVLLPVFSYTFTNKSIEDEKDRSSINRVFNIALYYSLLITLPLIIFVGALAKPILFLFITKSFAQAPLYLTLISIGTVIGLIGNYINSFFIAGGKIIKQLKYNGISTIAQIVVMLLVIQRFGVIGAIFAIFFVGGILDLYLFVRGAERIFKIKFEYRKLLSLFLANALLFVILFSLVLIKHLVIELFIGIVLLAVLYPILLVLLKSISREDIVHMKKITAKVPALEPIMLIMAAYLSFLMGKTSKSS